CFTRNDSTLESESQPASHTKFRIPPHAFVADLDSEGVDEYNYVHRLGLGVRPFPHFVDRDSVTLLIAQLVGQPAARRALKDISKGSAIGQFQKSPQALSRILCTSRMPSTISNLFNNIEMTSFAERLRLRLSERDQT
ncbi:hypothetical protein, partial [Burkholderia multivorans]|uniref:hypothetical protein n=1 Tax=Burkholderia multivorans TaxID=87883 RepID=UPI001C6131E9